MFEVYRVNPKDEKIKELTGKNKELKRRTRFLAQIVEYQEDTIKEQQRYIKWLEARVQNRAPYKVDISTGLVLVDKSS